MSWHNETRWGCNGRAGVRGRGTRTRRSSGSSPRSRPESQVFVTPVALTIAGSDPSGGAGIQADLKTFHQFGVYGEAVIALITVQNTMRVERVEYLSADLVLQQLRVAIEDIPPAAAKTGALGSAAVVEAVAAADLPCPLVVDPVTMGK